MRIFGTRVFEYHVDGLEPDWGSSRMTVLEFGTTVITEIRSEEGEVRTVLDEYQYQWWPNWLLPSAPLRYLIGMTSTGMVFGPAKPEGYVASTTETVYYERFGELASMTEVNEYNDEDTLVQLTFVAGIANEFRINSKLTWSDGSEDYTSVYTVGGEQLEEIYWFYGPNGELKEDSCMIYQTPGGEPSEPGPAPPGPPRTTLRD